MAGASSRLLRATTKPLHQDNKPCHLPSLRFPFLQGRKQHRLSHRSKQMAAMIPLGAASITSDNQRKLFRQEETKNIDLLLPLVYEVTRRLIHRLAKVRWLALTPQHWSKIVQALIEQVVIRCQSFTLIGVAGSLIGSVLCFVEGCGVVLKSFFMHFQAMSQMIDQGELIKVLIEAIDMFLVGTAMLTFGMGLYIMFCGAQNSNERGLQINKSNLGTFNLRRLKEGAKIQTITQAKTRVGHVIVLLLQAGVLEKFKNVPLVSSLDMACFAGAVLASSACVFLLSKLRMQQQQCRQTCA